MISEVEIPSVRLVSLNFPTDLTYIKKLIDISSMEAENFEIFTSSVKSKYRMT